MRTLKLFAIAALACLLVPSCKKKEVKPVTAITFSETSMEMMPGDSKPLTVSCTPQDATNLDKLTIVSSNEELVEYHDGVVVAKAGGLAWIEATCESVTGACIVKVFHGYFYKRGDVFNIDRISGYSYLQGEQEPQSLEITLTKSGTGEFESDNLTVFVSRKDLGKKLDFSKPIEEFCYASVYANNNEDGYTVFGSSEGTPMITNADWTSVNQVTLRKGELLVDDLGGNRYKIYADFLLSDGFAFGTDWEGAAYLKVE